MAMPWVAILVVLGILAGAAGTLVLTACVLSSMISRYQEQRR